MTTAVRIACTPARHNGGVKITMMLADAAQQVGGKLYILGGGWSTTGSPTAPMAVAIKIEVPWDRTNVDTTGAWPWSTPTVVPSRRRTTAPSRSPVSWRSAAPPGLPDGTPLDAPLVVSFGSMPLQPGRYEWRLEIEEFVESCAFLVRS